MKALLHWVLSALAIWIVSRLVPGFSVSGPLAALIAAVPLTIVTFGIFWLVINALMIELASALVPGFRVDTFGAAFWGAIVLSLVNMALKWLILPERPA